MTRWKSVFEILVMALVACAAGLVIWRQSGFDKPAGSRPRVESASGTLPAELTTLTRGSGPIALVEFADFECPFCGRHARSVGPMIRKAFVDTALVRHVFMNLPLAIHPHAQAASEASFCALRQGKFWEMYESLFEDQKSLKLEDLIARAATLGLEQDQFDQCLTSGESKAVVERQKSLARELEVRATPAFFIGSVQPDGSVVFHKRLNGALPFSEFRSALMDAIPEHLKSRAGDVARAPFSRELGWRHF
jgi:protein-disulfide isomerase